MGVVVLAAGFGSRFSGTEVKLLAELGGRPILRSVLDAAGGVRADMHLIVTQNERLDHLIGPPFVALRNPHPELGLASSLGIAIDAAEAMGLEAVVVGLGDQPLVPPAAWERVAHTPTHGVAIATYAGKRGNPVKIASSVFGLLERQGDIGARSIFGRVEAIEVPCTGDPFDIDTPADLEYARAAERN